MEAWKHGSMEAWKHGRILCKGLLLGLACGAISMSLVVKGTAVAADDIKLSEQSTVVLDNTVSNLISEVKSELAKNHQDALEIYILGEGSPKYSEVFPDRLGDYIKDYKPVRLNGKAIHGRAFFMMKKEDQLVSTKEEYDRIIAERFSNLEKFDYPTIHYTFDAELKDKYPYLNLILKANGLSLSDSISLDSILGINGVTIHTQHLRIDNQFAYRYTKDDYKQDSHITFDRFKKNDDKLKELIATSGANQEGLTDAQRVKAYVLYMANHVDYDWEAARYNPDYLIFCQASDLFALTERNKAMCIGFSTAAARGLNLLGIPSYVTYGRNRNGAAHAAIRVFYDKKWRTLDVTGVGRGKYTEEHYDNLNTHDYKIFDLTKETDVDLDRGYMEIYKDFEDWILSHNTKELLFINQDANIRNKVAKDDFKYIQESEKQSLIDKLKKFVFKVENISSYFKKEHFKKLVIGLGEDAKNELAKLTLSPDLEEDDYKKSKTVLEWLNIYYSQCIREDGDPDLIRKDGELKEMDS
ncbi:TPA: hypothetical protein TU173_001495 [Streptococcus equi subsp. zooepidemicus]|nr:hypothetical protein [Streptococcus equi subsp. zooepidemicus]HEL0807434.1 hypothetical protein [Streptococcus equi subsp. zooepidemicus]